jgi:hypothetical protein
MSSDLILEDESIRFEGPTFDMHGHTLILDNILPRNSETNPAELRRPLVHDAGDSLTINWQEKYTGGVSVMGHVAMPGTVSIAALSIQGAVDITGPLRIDLGVRPAPSSNGVEIRPGNAGGLLDDLDLVDTTASHTDELSDPFQILLSTRSPVDLAREIRILRHLVLKLDERLKALESR